MRLMTILFLACAVQLSGSACQAQTPTTPQQDWASRPVIKVWGAVAPGSENDHRKESKMMSPPAFGSSMHIVRNVVSPSLTVFQPSGGNSTRTAVLICPGGGFRILAIDEEGYMVADWFSQHGVTAFVLKYRVAETPESDPDFAPPGESMEAGLKRVTAPLPQDAIPHAVADGIQALKVIREGAAKYGYASNRVVAVGFSAGGGVVTGTGLALDPAERPDYVAPIYGALPSQTVEIPKNTPPFFMAVAEDDPLVKPMVFRLLEALRNSGASPEFHLYRSGQHGFSMKQRGTSDHWIDELWWWMESFGLTHANTAK